MFVRYRCLSTNSNNSDFVGLCQTYYSPENGYYSGSEISGLQMALPRINDIFHDQHNDNPCVDFLLNYLCHYYFPQCNLTTGEITPVCSSTCALLANNEDCADLGEIANEELEINNIPSPNDSCFQTFRSYNTPPTVSEGCLSIEG